MEKVIKDYLDQARVGRKQSYRNLAVFPLLSPYSAALTYITLDDAFSGGHIFIEELNEGGSVPELKVVNKSDKMILILDGEELVGAKQNRIVNITILMQAKSTTVIPVSCVEQGRWYYNARHFHSEKRMMSAGLRAMKARHVENAVRATGRYQADQGAIWNEISEKATRRDAESVTMAMAAIYDKDEAPLDEYLKHFKLSDMQVGAVFAINGKVVGVDCFGKPETFAGVFRKLLQSYALDAIDWFDPEKKSEVSKSDVTKFMAALAKADMESRLSVGMGTDIRLSLPNLSGFALALDDQVLHLSAFAQEDQGKPGHGRRSPMGRFSSRRRLRQ